MFGIKMGQSFLVCTGERKMANSVKKQWKGWMKKGFITISICTVLMILICVILALFVNRNQVVINQKKVDLVQKPEITELFLTPNKYSRPQTELDKVNGIVVHYTANPGSSAEGNRNYFENLRKKKTTYASSHFVIGLEGEIIQCIPLDEIAYCSNNRNADTISIECCHPDKSGKFEDATYESLVKLVAWLCGKYNLTKAQIIRHYDVTGKLCPKYFVEHEDEWEEFKDDVFIYIKENPFHLDSGEEEEESGQE